MMRLMPWWGMGEPSFCTSRHGLLSNLYDCESAVVLALVICVTYEIDGITCWVTEMNFSLSMTHSVRSDAPLIGLQLEKLK